MYPKKFQNLIDQFSSLPSIGPKLAERLVLSLYKKESEVSVQFARALSELHNITTCSRCYNIAEDELCAICRDDSRDRTTLCIVEEPLDIIPIERSRSYTGNYHVLLGTLKGTDAGHLTIPALLTRIDTDNVQEVILATNFTTEGDVTALYIKNLLTDKNVRITRLVRGLATGSDIEYADDLTLQSALTNRTQM